MMSPLHAYPENEFSLRRGRRQHWNKYNTANSLLSINLEAVHKYLLAIGESIMGNIDSKC